MLCLDHVQIAAPIGCEDAAREFYGQILGLKEIAKPTTLTPSGVWFDLGAHQLHVGIQTPFTPALKAHVGLACRPDKIGEIATRLTKSGHPVSWDTRLPNARRFFCSDPWGNRLEILAWSV